MPESLSEMKVKLGNRCILYPQNNPYAAPATVNEMDLPICHCDEIYHGKAVSKVKTLTREPGDRPVQPSMEIPRGDGTKACCGLCVSAIFRFLIDSPRYFS